MSQRRVVITGLGQVSPVGNTVAEAWDTLLAGKSGIGAITRFDASDINSRVAGEVRGFDIGQYISAKEARRMDVFIHYGIAAALQAIADSGLDDVENLDKDRIGVNIGSGIGGLPSIEVTGKAVIEGGARKINPFFIPGSLINLISGHVTILKGYRGPSYGMVSACTTGAHAIGNSARLIKYGDADIMVAGGAEGAISTLGVGGFAAMKALSTRNDDPATASRPWDKGRDGFVIGEGAGIFVLEELEHAKKRGAKIYAEIVGYGANSDAYHISTPRPDAQGAILAFQTALQHAGLAPEDIGWINLHGTGTHHNDSMESRAVAAVFGNNTPCTSTKPQTGHTLGAAGAIEAAFAWGIADRQSNPEGKLPPQLWDGQNDPNLPAINLTGSGSRRETEKRITASSSFALGGSNCVLIIG
ncbi:beta-ketoacyl-ACP synthase II [Neisseria meningitidis]|nr:beta-ketoacyl-ACP synthase II [Neisseria meningitidis]